MSVNETTPKAAAVAKRRTILEQIGRRRRRLALGLRNLWTTFQSGRDYTQPDYAFYDRARRGQAAGLEISGLFIKPLAGKIGSYVLGDAPSFGLAAPLGSSRVLNEAVTAELAADVTAWFARNHALIAHAYEEALILGDSYLVFNGDGTLSTISPNVIAPLVEDDDYTNVIGWHVKEGHQHPTENRRMVIEDHYYADRRVRTVQMDGSEDKSVTTYPNPLGRVTVVHLSNMFGLDEFFGRSEAGALIPALQQYGAVLDSALKGNIRQGRPTPVIEGMGTAEDVEMFWAKYGKDETITAPDGTTQTVTTIEFDADKLITLPNGQFSYKSPGAFAAETEKLLGLLFYILIEHSEQPEYAWGTALASSKASAETQADSFHRYIAKKRGAANRWLLELMRLALTYFAILRSRNAEQMDIQTEWPPLSQEAADTVLRAVDLARREGLIDDATALRKLPLGIRDVDEVLQQARDEQAERQQQFEDQTQAAIDRVAAAPDPEPVAVP